MAIEGKKREKENNRAHLDINSRYSLGMTSVTSVMRFWDKDAKGNWRQLIVNVLPFCLLWVYSIYIGIQYILRIRLRRRAWARALLSWRKTQYMLAFAPDTDSRHGICSEFIDKYLTRRSKLIDLMSTRIHSYTP